MAQPYWSGVFPAVTTQFRKDLSLDIDATARHWEVLIASGVSGLIVAGSLGENQTLEPAEKRTLVAEAVRVAAGRVPILSGVAEMSTAAACQYVRDCEQLGAAGFMVMPAMVYKADPAEAINHFRKVAAATRLPWMLYNNPLGVSGRHHAGAVRRTGRHSQPGRAQGKLRQHPANHRVADRSRRSVQHFYRRR